MKVVLFCGGRGLRMGGPGRTPKPLTPIGQRPVVWHLMRWYAHWGHKEFVLCLGHHSGQIKRYFLDYEEAIGNDFTLSDGGATVEVHERDIADWTITFVDTGLHACVGERLKAVEHVVGRDEPFLANYADGLSDLDLDAHVAAARSSGAVATFMAAAPASSFHTVDMAADGRVRAVRPLNEAGVWLNAGFFVLQPSIFDHLGAGEDLVDEPFERLAAAGQLRAHRHHGFWRPMDTFKDAEVLRDLHARGVAPWEVWNGNGSRAPSADRDVVPFAA